MSEKRYILTEKQLLRLLESQSMLIQLGTFGVDNWDGYGAWHEEDPDWDCDTEAREDLVNYEEYKVL